MAEGAGCPGGGCPWAALSLRCELRQERLSGGRRRRGSHGRYRRCSQRSRRAGNGGRQCGGS
eukprot:7510809-Prorocentrum_lima.AAC.1